MKGTEGKTLTLPFISSVDALSRVLELDPASKEEIDSVSSVYPFRIPLYYAGLIEKGNPSCPIRLQSIPTASELESRGVPDPLNEKSIEITPSFFKRYPKRGVFLATTQCAMYCRFCNRRRLVGRGIRLEQSREETLTYLEREPEIQEVIVSGGDPFMLDPSVLDYLFSRLRRIKHIRVIRVSTRMPVVFPERMEGHRKAVRKYSPLWIVIHINHPREVTPEFLDACRTLREAGAMLISQTVLLRRINDCPHILALLFERLVEAGIKPYYLFQLDDVVGAGHFKVRVHTGISIMKALRANISGLCIPHYALDITGGLGKVPIDYAYLKKRRGKGVRVENLCGEEGLYRDDGEGSRCANCGICRAST